MTSAGPMLMPMLMLLLLLLFALLLPEGVKNYKIATKCKLNQRGSRRKKKYKKTKQQSHQAEKLHWEIRLADRSAEPQDRFLESMVCGIG